MGRRISKSNENVGLSMVRYPWEIEPIEPYERPETYSLYTNKECGRPNSILEKNIRPNPNIKATIRVGDRVYNMKYNKKEKGLTAVIVSSNLNTICFSWDVDGKEEMISHKKWVMQVPFRNVDKYPSIYRNVQDTNSFLGIRFDNLVNPMWIKGFLRPYFNSTNNVLEFSLFDKKKYEHCDITDESTYSKYELKAYIPTDTDDIGWWEQFFIKVLDQFRTEGIDYVGIPYIYDLCKLNKRADIIQIGFETVLQWIKLNSDFSMKVIFLCCSIHEYNEYKKISDKHTVNMDDSV